MILNLKYKFNGGNFCPTIFIWITSFFILVREFRKITINYYRKKTPTPTHTHPHQQYNITFEKRHFHSVFKAKEVTPKIKSKT